MGRCKLFYGSIGSISSGLVARLADAAKSAFHKHRLVVRRINAGTFFAEVDADKLS